MALHHDETGRTTASRVAKKAKRSERSKSEHAPSSTTSPTSPTSPTKPSSPKSGVTDTPAHPSSTATSQAIDQALKRKRKIYIVFAAMGILGSVLLAYVFFFRSSGQGSQKGATPSKTMLGNFTEWAAVVGSQSCAGVPRKIFTMKGTIGDAAVASILCVCTVRPNNCGIGGGLFAIYYDRLNKKATVINARETAPANLTAKMLEAENASTIGPLSTGVPSFLSGLDSLLKATKSKVKWNDLVADALYYAKKGVIVSKELANDIQRNAKTINANMDLKEYLSEKRVFYKAGDTMVQDRMAETLTAIGKDGPSTFYKGTLRNKLLDDMKRKGCKITQTDMSNYNAEQEEPVKINLAPYTLYAPKAPGGGTVLGLILGLVSTFLTRGELIDDEQHMHYLVESIKYGMARRTSLADPKFFPLENVLKDFTSKTYIDRMATKIRPKALRDASAYGITPVKNDKGSGQIAIVAANGDAVAITASINSPFGSQVISKSTGIILNNVIDNFYLRDQFDLDGNLETPNNKISPGKRPLSNMAPTIVTDPSGNVVAVASSTGGPKIVSGLTQVLARMLWMKANPKVAIDSGRLHHQLRPYVLFAESSVPKDILDGLRKRSHDVQILSHWGNDVIALLRRKNRILAAYDFRKQTDAGVDGGMHSANKTG
ncbi:scoloptoxin SSD14-like [Ornithodoros turicata]|uniref:scoloptoxin SSD14-like n=1 Tax=Ornithodoros turicata TaxID=34597 RepID=UPI0031386701